MFAVVTDVCCELCFVSCALFLVWLFIFVFWWRGNFWVRLFFVVLYFVAFFWGSSFSYFCRYNFFEYCSALYPSFLFYGFMVLKILRVQVFTQASILRYVNLLIPTATQYQYFGTLAGRWFMHGSCAQI